MQGVDGRKKETYFSYTGPAQREVGEALRVVTEHDNDIRSTRHGHFPG